MERWTDSPVKLLGVLVWTRSPGGEKLQQGNRHGGGHSPDLLVGGGLSLLGKAKVTQVLIVFVITYHLTVMPCPVCG